MKIKTSELTDVALNWAVIMCESGIEYAMYSFTVVDQYGQPKPSSNWAQGGPIVEREKINLVYSDEQWEADISDEHFGFGGTALCAAMRCYVASKLGDEVEVPSDLATSLELV